MRKKILFTSMIPVTGEKLQELLTYGVNAAV